MFGIFDRSRADPAVGPQVSRKLCTDRFNGRYPHVGLFDCRAQQVWVCKPLNGQAVRTSHAALITGTDDATSTAWKDRFLCFWFYTPGTGSGLLANQRVNWDEAHLVVRVDGTWDYDRQRLIPIDLQDQQADNLARQARHAARVLDFYSQCDVRSPIHLHLSGQRKGESVVSLKIARGGKGS
jgi:hypothetical protein